MTHFGVSLSAKHEAGKETERGREERVGGREGGGEGGRRGKKEIQRKNRSRAALRIHSANDITRPRTSSRCDTLTFPHRDSRDFKDPEVLASPSNFTVLRKSGRSSGGCERSSRNSPVSATRILARRAVHGRAREGNANGETKRNEAKHGRDPTGWCCGPPECLAGLRGFRYLGLGVGRM